MQKLIYFQSFILFVLMFTFPKVLSNVKILLVIFISLGHLAFLLSGKLKLNIYYLMYHLIFSTLTLFFLLNGLASGNSDVAILDGFRLYFGFMILYYFIFIGFDRLDFVTLILKAYCYSVIFIFITIITMFIDTFYGLAIVPSFISEPLNMKMGIHGGYTDTSLTSVTSLIFIAPSVFCLYIYENDFYKTNKILVNISLVCTLIAVLFTGRRVLQIIFLMTPILSIIYFVIVIKADVFKRVKLSVIKFYILIPFMISLLFLTIFDLDLDSLMNRWNGLSLSEQPERINQLYSLYEGLASKPIFGHGSGAVADVIRSSNAPWHYELTYSYLLFSTGVFGFVSLFVLVGGSFILATSRLSLYRSNKIEITSIMFGFLMFFVSVATNPYFSGFDTLFIVSLIPFILFSNRYNHD
jgi:hypothetical protein